MRSALRKDKFGEVFTPQILVQEMLDQLPSDSWVDPSKTFLDNSCGHGNFLVEILRRKLQFNHPVITALTTIFGLDIQQDNVDECKARLLELVDETHRSEAKKIIDHNIVCHDAFTWDYENWKSTEVKVKALF
jgi:type I restriction-modification system DNA methylase subunit